MSNLNKCVLGAIFSKTDYSRCLVTKTRRKASVRKENLLMRKRETVLQ